MKSNRKRLRILRTFEGEKNRCGECINLGKEEDLTRGSGNHTTGRKENRRDMVPSNRTNRGLEGNAEGSISVAFTFGALSLLRRARLQGYGVQKIHD